MTDVENTSTADVAPEPDRVPEPEAPPPPSPEPRITNDTVGKKKQKEAVRRLSDYSREVRSRKAEPIDADPQPEADPAPPADPEAPPPESSMSIGNIIAAAGVVVAAVCLYLSYRSPKVPETPEEEPKAPPKAPKAPRAPKAVKNAPEPKFRRL